MTERVLQCTFFMLPPLHRGLLAPVRVARFLGSCVSRTEGDGVTAPAEHSGAHPPPEID